MSVATVLANERLVLQKAQTAASLAAMIISKARAVARGTSAIGIGPIGGIKGAGLIAAGHLMDGTRLQLLEQIVKINLQQSGWATINQLQTMLRLAHGGQTTLILSQIHEQIALIKQAEIDAMMLRDTVRHSIPDIMKLIRTIQAF